MTSIETTRTDIPETIRAMRNAGDFDRLKAAGAFQDMTPETMEAVLDVYSRENRRKPLRFWSALIGVQVSVSLLITLVIGLIFGHVSGGYAGAATGIAMAAAAAWASTPLQRRLTVLLTQMDDPHLVGPLTDALDRQEFSSRRAAVAALVRLLPYLTREHARGLTPERRTRLCKTLAGDSAELAGAVLEAAVRTGDTSCYPLVERLAEGKGLARKHSGLREAARKALPELAALREQERQASSLLRPADAPDAATLLRPAPGVPSDDASSLLRPADSYDEDLEERVGADA